MRPPTSPVPSGSTLTNSSVKMSRTWRSLRTGDRDLQRPRSSDWREGLSHVLKLGKYFWQGYGVFMGDHARKELETAMKEAEEALSTGNQAQGQRAKLAIENILWDSGTASVMFNAETVMQWANAEQTRLLARAIGELRRAHAQQAGGGPTEQFERLEQNVRAVTADIIRERVGPEAAGPKDFGGLLVTPKDL